MSRSERQIFLLTVGGDAQPRWLSSTQGQVPHGEQLTLRSWLLRVIDAPVRNFWDLGDAVFFFSDPMPPIQPDGMRRFRLVSGLDLQMAYRVHRSF